MPDTLTLLFTSFHILTRAFKFTTKIHLCVQKLLGGSRTDSNLDCKTKTRSPGLDKPVGPIIILLFGFASDSNSTKYQTNSETAMLSIQVQRWLHPIFRVLLQNFLLSCCWTPYEGHTRKHCTDRTSCILFCRKSASAMNRKPGSVINRNPTSASALEQLKRLHYKQLPNNNKRLPLIDCTLLTNGFLPFHIWILDFIGFYDRHPNPLPYYGP